METLQTLLLDPLTLKLLSTHPNNYAVETTYLRLPHVDDWLDLIQFYATGEFEETWRSTPRIPDELVRLMTSIRRLQLPREPIYMPGILPLRSEQGMSPKKAHEVSRMATYIVNLASRLPSSSTGLRIVDIGAGQGYLTRALKFHLPHSHVLALDADIEQTKGAQKWEKRLLPKDAQCPPIDHKVVFISPDPLLAVVDEWVDGDSQKKQEELEGKEGEKVPVPVLFVALHACGSLTPDILRAFVKAAKQPNKRNWYPAGVVVVGCCYNLMNPADHPPSTKHLPVSAYHLAAQIPSQWLLLSSSSTDPAKLDPTVALSIRKVTWRALLSKALENASSRPSAPSESPNSHSDSVPTSTDTQTKSTTVPACWSRRPQSQEDDMDKQYAALKSGTGFTPTMNRLGRLRNSVYTSWNTFLRAAEDKLGVTFEESEFDEEDNGTEENGRGRANGAEVNETEQGRKRRGRDKKLENELAALHVLRCLLGPAIESAILMDRIEWFRKELELGIESQPRSHPLESGEGRSRKEDQKTERHDNFHKRPRFKAELVNLFDQATGSGRNVAIVVELTS